MTKQDAINQLETITKKLIHIDYRLDSNELKNAIKEVARVQLLIENGEIKPSKTRK